MVWYQYVYIVKCNEVIYFTYIQPLSLDDHTCIDKKYSVTLSANDEAIRIVKMVL